MKKRLLKENPMKRKNKSMLVLLLTAALILACSSITISVNNNKTTEAPTKSQNNKETTDPQGNKETNAPTKQDQGKKATDPPSTPNPSLTVTPTQSDQPTDTVVVVPVPSGDITLTKLTPDSVDVGSTKQIVVTGSGFVDGITLFFYDGKGPEPTVEDVEFVDAQTLIITVKIKSGGSPEKRVWHLSASNPNGDSAILENALTITP